MEVNVNVDEMREAGAALLSAKKAAAFCGISVRQWWRWNSSGSTPRAVRIGSTKRWRRDELQSWIEAGCPTLLEWESRRKR